MKKYTIEITETLTRIVSIEAETEYEAERIVREKYKNCEIVLDADDFVDYEIHICEQVIAQKTARLGFSNKKKRSMPLFLIYVTTVILYHSIH